MDQLPEEETPRLRFLNYADDTIRSETFGAHDFRPDYSDDEPLPGRDTPQDPVTRRKGGLGPVAIGAAAVVAAGGLAMLGPTLRDDASRDAGAPRPGHERFLSIARVTPSPPVAAPPAPLSPSLRLEVLRAVPEAVTVRTADRPLGTELAAAPASAPPRPASRGSGVPPAPDPGRGFQIAEQVPPTVPELREAPRAVRARLPAPLECDGPSSLGQSVVCDDPGLIAADRQMVDAYEAAAAAGAPTSVLWREQVSWLNAREAAAQRSRWAVEDLYRQRIRDLRAAEATLDNR